MRSLILLWAALYVSTDALAQGKGPSPGHVSPGEVVHVRNVIASCLRKTWRISGEGPFVRVTLRWSLDRSGRLLGTPEIADPQGSSAATPSARAAMRAVRACEPFRLPTARYDVWKVIVWEFDPTGMPN
jgi:colicin import membrane protein